MERMEPSGWPAAGEKRAPARWLMCQIFTKTRQKPRPFRDATAADDTRHAPDRALRMQLKRYNKEAELASAWVWVGVVCARDEPEDKQHDKRQGESQRGAADEETSCERARGVEVAHVEVAHVRQIRGVMGGRDAT